MTNDRRVATVLSADWYEHAEVLITECGHRHVRSRGSYRSGDVLACPFCEERETFPIDPHAPVINSDEDDT